jgi:hypothetical protein
MLLKDPFLMKKIRFTGGTSPKSSFEGIFTGFSVNKGDVTTSLIASGKK